jgi:hypothetical protein
MGAVLGIAAWSRGQEKIQGMNTNGYSNNYPNNYPNTYDNTPVYPRQQSTTYTKTTTTSLSGRRGPILEEDPVL